MSARRTLLARVVPLAAACMLSGCGMFGGPKAVKPEWKSLRVMTAIDANENSALAVDLVLVSERAMVDGVAALTAAQYFATRADLQRIQPDALMVLSLELPPGQSITIDPKQFRARPVWAALLFANYSTPGPHRVRLQLDNGGYLLQMNAQDLQVTDSKTGAAR